MSLKEGVDSHDSVKETDCCGTSEEACNEAASCEQIENDVSKQNSDASLSHVTLSLTSVVSGK